MEDYIEIECDECDGEGYYEELEYCFKPMSECCGGCYKEIECEKCNGNGYLLEEKE